LWSLLNRPELTLFGIKMNPGGLTFRRK